MFVWRSNLLGSSGKGHEYFLKHLLGTDHGVQGKDLGETGRDKPRGSEVARRGARRKTRSPGLHRFPDVDDGCLFGHRPADRDLVREKRSQHLRHASLHPPARRGGGSGLGVASSDWEIFKAIAKTFSEIARKSWAKRTDVVLTPIQHDSAGELAQRGTSRIGSQGECDPDARANDAAGLGIVERDYPNLFEVHLARSADGQARQRREGTGWNTQHEVDKLKHSMARCLTMGRPGDARRSSPTSTRARQS
jgi:nitrate reductase alpha subunit